MLELPSHGRTHREIVAEAERVAKKATLWNLAASMVNALTSVVLLFVLTRVTSIEIAGMFSIAYANANLWLNLGKYGMRPFQVSDWVERFSYAEYWISRLITTALMVVGGLAWLAYAVSTGGYTDYKVAVVAWMVAFKAVDALEDMYHGRYQQQGQLDVAAMLLTLRMGSTLVVFSVLAALSHDLLMPLVVSTLYTLVFWNAGVVWARSRYDFARIGGRLSMREVAALLREAAPLAVQAFLVFYVGNAAKYSIDALMDDGAQACFNFIAMPIFVVSLLASTIYNPLIVGFTSHWNEGRRAPFMAMLRRQLLIIAGLTAGCDVLCALFGVPVLSWLFNTDLSAYWWELLILMTGGGLSALTMFLATILTVIRRQKWLAAGYVPAALFAFLASDPFVSAWGLTGASWVYFIAVALPVAFFSVVTWVFLNRPEAFSAAGAGPVEVDVVVKDADGSSGDGRADAGCADAGRAGDEHASDEG